MRFFLIALLMALIACSPQQTGAPPSQIPAKKFIAGFESVDEFKGFYIVPQNHMATASHDLVSELSHSGEFAHKGWIYGINPDSTAEGNNNHRAYPTIQLYKTAEGAYKTPVLIEFYVWLNVALVPGQWFSFATLDHTRGDTWDPVLVNLSDDGFVHLMHLPNNGQKNWDYQTTDLTFPMNQWVKLSICLHFDEAKGYAKVWQDDVLVSSGPVERGAGELTQAHFGLYAPPSLAGGEVYNDDLTITEDECL